MDSRIDDFFYKEIGCKLDEQRIKLGYSLRYLSKLTGISRSQLDVYMCGKNRIKKDTYEVLCKALHIKPTISINVNIG